MSFGTSQSAPVPSDPVSQGEPHVYRNAHPDCRQLSRLDRFCRSPPAGASICPWGRRTRRTSGAEHRALEPAHGGVAVDRSIIGARRRPVDDRATGPRDPRPLTPPRGGLIDLFRPLAGPVDGSASVGSPGRSHFLVPDSAPDTRRAGGRCRLFRIRRDRSRRRLRRTHQGRQTGVPGRRTPATRRRMRPHRSRANNAGR